MKKLHVIRLILLLILLLSGSKAICQQSLLVNNTGYTIGSQTNTYRYFAGQTPANLVEIYSPLNDGGSGYPRQYQWEQSLTPVTGFSIISGATSRDLNLSSVILNNTMYYRCKVNCTITFQFFLSTVTVNFSFYSNTVKLEVIPPDWENRSYVREYDILKQGVKTTEEVYQLAIGDKLQNTTYYDGLNRPVQQVSKETATPSNPRSLWGDNVQIASYDNYGRQQKLFLPYTTVSQSGKYKTNSIAEQAQYYSNNFIEDFPYNQITQYDNSPLDRLINYKKGGTSWQAGTGQTTSYELNTSTDNVIKWRFDHYNTLPQATSVFYLGYPQGQGAYAANTLFKNTYTDEQQKKVVEFTDQTGRLILKKVQVADNPIDGHEGWACTYNVYDEFGQLRCVMPPEAVKQAEKWNWEFKDGNEEKIQNICFFYAYDEKGRNIIKKAPNAAPLFMLYDNKDRLVFMQDGNQRNKTLPGYPYINAPEWTVNVFDELDRIVLVTLYATNKTFQQLQYDITAGSSSATVLLNNAGEHVVDLVVDTRISGVTEYKAENSIEFVAAGSGFETTLGDEFTAEISVPVTKPATVIPVSTNENILSSNELNNPAVCTILKYNFYDHYGFSGLSVFDHAYNLGYNSNDEGIQPVITTSRTLDFLTGSKVRVLNTNTFLSTSIYYDENGYTLQSNEENIKNGRDITTFQYHFDGKIMSMYEKHTAEGTGYHNFGVLTTYYHDRIGRVAGISKNFGNNSSKEIVNYSYDDLGRLRKKILDPEYSNVTTGKNQLESLEYSYNLHGYITGINKRFALKLPDLTDYHSTYSQWAHYFGLYLGYDNKDNIFTSGLQNGMVAGILWNSQGDDAQRKFEFEYDNMGRLKNAWFKEKEKSGDVWNNLKMDFSTTGRNGKIEYDLNGNLQYLMHKGVLPGSGVITVDDLKYDYDLYNYNQNRLLKVSDNSPLGANNGKLGDFKDGLNSGNDYAYDENGNAVSDMNKRIEGNNGIKYNYLDKPEQIYIEDKGDIVFVYDADGNKLQKIFTPKDSDEGYSKITTYINGFIYEETKVLPFGAKASLGGGGKLASIGFEEGRIRAIEPINHSNGNEALFINGNLDLLSSADGKMQQGVFDYYIRDYQENVRMILTEEEHFSIGKCTMESSRAVTEEPVFGQPGSGNEVASTRFAVNNIPGQTVGDGWNNSDIQNQVSRLYKTSAINKSVGSNSLLKVMAGDEISATVQYFYKAAVANSSETNLIGNILQSLLGMVGGTPAAGGVVHNQATAIYTQLNGNTAPILNAATPGVGSTNTVAPKAYLSVLFFDERFNFVSEGSTGLRVGEDPENSNANLTLTNIRAPKNGYVYIVVSNESPEPVYFDNLTVRHDRGRITEENHYYAFGLKAAGLSSTKAADPYEQTIKNNYLYNDKELIDDGDLDWYDYGFRFYDPQIGRFLQLDPLAFDFEYYSPYQYAGNEPIANVDLDGLEPAKILDGIIQATKLGKKLPWNLAGGTLDEVVVVADKIKKVAQPAAKASWLSKLNNVVSNVANVLSGIASAVVDDQSHGVINTRELGGALASNKRAYNLGQDIGDFVVNPIISLFEIKVGEAGTVGGVLAAPETGGLSLTVSAAGVGAIAQGISSGAEGIANGLKQKGRVDTEGSGNGGSSTPEKYKPPTENNKVNPPKNSDKPNFAKDAKPGKNSNGQKGWVDKKGNFITKGDKPGEWHVNPNPKNKKPLWEGKKPRYKSKQPYWNVNDNGNITH